MFQSSPRRLWAIIAAAGTVAIVALGWVLLISGEKSSRSDLLNQATDAQNQAAMTRARSASLRADNLKLPAYKAQLATLQRALPVGASSAAFVSDMQHLSSATSVSITDIGITPPSASTPGGAAPAPTPSGAPQAGTSAASTATELPITVTAQGTTAHLERFLSLLQGSEARALLLGQVTESVPAQGGGSTSADAPTLTVTMKAFFTNS